MRGKKGARSLERIDIRGGGYDIRSNPWTRGIQGVLGSGWIILDGFGFGMVLRGARRGEAMFVACACGYAWVDERI